MLGNGKDVLQARSFVNCHGVMGNNVAIIKRNFFPFSGLDHGELRQTETETVKPRYFEHSGEMKISFKWQEFKITDSKYKGQIQGKCF